LIVLWSARVLLLCAGAYWWDCSGKRVCLCLASHQLTQSGPPTLTRGASGAFELVMCSWFEHSSPLAIFLFDFLIWCHQRHQKLQRSHTSTCPFIFVHFPYSCPTFSYHCHIYSIIPLALTSKNVLNTNHHPTTSHIPLLSCLSGSPYFPVFSYPISWTNGTVMHKSNTCIDNTLGVLK
jgi:hypothetical protein